jgi:hypothetical protein
MDLLDFKNSSEGLEGEDVDLDMPHGLAALIQNNQCHKYNIYYMNNVLQKTKLNTFEDTAVERHHNSIGN